MYVYPIWSFDEINRIYLVFDKDPIVIQKLLILIVWLLIINMTAYSQGNWELLVPSTTSNQMVSLYFIDEYTGWSVGEYGTIIKTTDGGNTWNICEIDILTDLLDVHFSTESTGFVVGEDGLILKTTNGGGSWIKLDNEFSNNLNRVKFCNEETGWSIGEKGLILHTTDGGTTWLRQLSVSDDDLFGIDIIGQQKVIIVGDNNTILLTENDGADWELIEYTPLEQDETYKDVYFINDSTGWICGETKSDVTIMDKNGCILATTNGGKNWTDKSKINSLEVVGLLSGNILQPLQQIYFKNDLLKGLGLIGKHCTFFYCVGSFPIYTQNSGLNWQGYIDGSNEGFEAKGRFQFLTDSIVIATGFRGGFRFSEDNGSTWYFKNIYKRFWQDFIIGPDGSLHALSRKQNSVHSDTYTVRHYESQDNGNSWTEYIPTISFLDGSQKEIDWFDNFGQFTGSTGARLYTCYFNRTDSQFYILFSDDMGKTYHEVRGIQKPMDFLTPDTLISAILMPVEVEPGVYKSSIEYSYSFDGGVTIQTKMFDDIWNDITPFDLPEFKFIYDWFFLNSRLGFMVGRDGNILRTKDTGQSWENIYSGVVENLWDVEFLNEQTGFVVGEFGRVLKSEDGGDTWRKTDSGTQENIYSIAFLNEDEGWIGTESGMRYTIDGGETWQGVPLRYQHGTIHNIKFDHDGNGYAYTLSADISGNFNLMKESSGSYVLLQIMTENGTPIYDQENLIQSTPQQIILYANYPNPFNSSTRIDYYLPAAGDVMIKIFNIRGQLVRTLVNQPQKSGHRSAIWDGRSDKGSMVSSGMYIYQIQSNNQTKNRKLLLMK
jgi:photosystem II stability/assembly factor-like uncharacterized protein